MIVGSIFYVGYVVGDSKVCCLIMIGNIYVFVVIGMVCIFIIVFFFDIVFDLLVIVLI